MDGNVHPVLLQKQRVNESVLKMMHEMAEELLRQRNSFLQEREQLENRLVALETENVVLKKSIETHMIVINDMKFEIESLRSRAGTFGSSQPAVSRPPKVLHTSTPQTPTAISAVAQQAVADLEAVESSLTSDPELAALIKAYRERNNI